MAVFIEYRSRREYMHREERAERNTCSAVADRLMHVFLLSSLQVVFSPSRSLVALVSSAIRSYTPMEAGVESVYRTTGLVVTSTTHWTVEQSRSPNNRMLLGHCSITPHSTKINIVGQRVLCSPWQLCCLQRAEQKLLNRRAIPGTGLGRRRE